MARFLILPGDIRFNLGDTAICLGTIDLVRRLIPDASISVWGKRPVYPGGFEGVRFFEGPGLALAREAARCDAVLWGGGQLLQSNRSRVKLPYWAARIAGIRALGAPVIGFGQGVGPLPREADRKLVGRIVRKTRAFTVRDLASRNLLEDCGVPGDSARLTADPALLFDPPDGIGEDSTESTPDGPKTLGLSLRYVGHHRAGRVVPFQLLPEVLRRRALSGPGVARFRDAFVELAERIVAELDVDLVLFPMYHAPWETDEVLARAVEENVARARIHRVEHSLTELTRALRGLDAFVGTPMHSTILATSQGVPTLALHYEPKGREYMNRLELTEWAMPVDGSAPDVDAIMDRVRALWQGRDRIRQALAVAVPRLRHCAEANADPLIELLGLTPRVLPPIRHDVAKPRVRRPAEEVA